MRWNKQFCWHKYMPTDWRINQSIFILFVLYYINNKMVSDDIFHENNSITVQFSTRRNFDIQSWLLLRLLRSQFHVGFLERVFFAMPGRGPSDAVVEWSVSSMKVLAVQADAITSTVPPGSPDRLCTVHTGVRVMITILRAEWHTIVMLELISCSINNVINTC